MDKLKALLDRLFHSDAAQLGFIFSFAVLITALVFWCAEVSAEEVTKTWTDPTHNEDGTPIDQGENIRLWKLIDEVPFGVETYTSEELPGTYTYAATATATNGAESKFSEDADRVVTLLSAEVGAQVFQVVSISNGFWLIPIGTLAVQGDCSPSQSVNGYHVVLNASVNWAPGSTARPVTVVADCV